jgi:acylphosphatase
VSEADEPASGVVRRRVRVSGRVQGVWFRDQMREQARSLRVAGWVRNLADGRVEAELQGTRADVDRLVEWSRTGPPRARVSGVTVEDLPPARVEGFEIH